MCVIQVRYRNKDFPIMSLKGFYTVYVSMTQTCGMRKRISRLVTLADSFIYANIFRSEVCKHLKASKLSLVHVQVCQLRIALLGLSWVINFIPCSAVAGGADGCGLLLLMIFMRNRYCAHASSLHRLWLCSVDSARNKCSLLPAACCSVWVWTRWEPSGTWRSEPGLRSSRVTALTSIAAQHLIEDPRW